MKPPTFIECTVCGREFGSKSIAIHERQCLQKLRRTEICQDGDPTVQGKGRNKKRAPSVSPVPRTTAPERQERPTPWEQSPQQILLPKIQTDYGKKGRKNQELLRPTTATLSKPKFLNPEYIRHDMSLTRIDYSTTQLRINDDENQNLAYNRHNIVLPSVNLTKGNKQKNQSLHKLDATNGRGVVKLPESTKMSLPVESKKQNGPESTSLGVVLPNNSEIRMLDPFYPVQKSQSFPLLHSRDFVMKKMKANEKPFPRIPNDRIPNWSTSNHSLTPTTLHLPRWEDGGGRRHLPGEDENLPRIFFPNPQCPEEEAEVLTTTAIEELEFFNQGHEISVPEVICVRNTESFDTLSQESFGSSVANSSYETLIMRVISFTNAYLKASKEAAEINSTLEEIDLIDGFKGHGIHIPDSEESEFHNSLDQLPSSCFVPEEPEQTEEKTSVPSFTPLCINLTEAVTGSGDSESHLPSPKSILKRPSISGQSSPVEHQPELLRSPHGNSTSSGSDCDNEGTSSGYGLLHTVTTRPILDNRKKSHPRQFSTTTKVFSGNQRTYSIPSVPNCTGEVMDKIMTISHKKLAAHDTKTRSRSSKLSTNDKVNEWLEACATVSQEDEIEGKSAVLEGSERTFEKNSAMTRPKGSSRPLKLSTKDPPACKEQRANERVGPYPEKTVSGLVTVTFKVKDGDETRTYNFVNKTKMKGGTPSATRRCKTTASVMKKNRDLFRCYAPPKCLRADKQVVKMLKKLEFMVQLKRPKTVPPKTLRCSTTHADGQNNLKRPQTTTAINKLGRVMAVPSPIFQNKLKDQPKMGANPGKALHAPKICCTTGNAPPTSLAMAFSSNPHTGEIQNAPKIRMQRKSGWQRDDLKLRPRPPTPIPKLSLSTQKSTLLWTRPNLSKVKVDKSSQAPETRSTCVQISTVAPLQTKLHRNLFGSPPASALS